MTNIDTPHQRLFEKHLIGIDVWLIPSNFPNQYNVSSYAVILFFHNLFPSI